MDIPWGVYVLGSRKGTVMCRAVKCRVCGKTTWSGCGQHIATVKAGVPADMIRLSVGIESIDDILWDIEQALGAAVPS